MLLITVELTEKFTWKSPVFRGSMSVALLERTFSQSRNFSKKLLYYRCVPVNFAKYFKTNFFYLWGIPSGNRCKNALYVLEKCMKTSLINTTSPLQKFFFQFSKTFLITMRKNKSKCRVLYKNCVVCKHNAAFGFGKRPVHNILKLIRDMIHHK